MFAAESIAVSSTTFKVMRPESYRIRWNNATQGLLRRSR